MTQPSGARLPFRITRPPVGLRGLFFARTTSCPGVSLAAAASSAMVLPVTVMQSPCSRFGFQHALCDQGRAACFVEIGGDETAAGFEVGENGRARADAVEVVDGKRNARFAGDGQQMQNGVRRTAGRGDSGDGVFDGSLGDDFGWRQIVAKQVDGKFAGKFAGVRFAGVRSPERWKCPWARGREIRRRAPWCWR